MKLTNDQLHDAKLAVAGLCTLLNANLPGKVTVNTATCELGGELGNFLYGLIVCDKIKGWIPTSVLGLDYQQVIQEYVEFPGDDELQFITLEVDTTEYPF